MTKAMTKAMKKTRATASIGTRPALLLPAASNVRSPSRAFNTLGGGLWAPSSSTRVKPRLCINANTWDRLAARVRFRTDLGADGMQTES